MRNLVLLLTFFMGFASNSFAQDIKLIYRGSTIVNGDYAERFAAPEPEMNETRMPSADADEKLRRTFSFVPWYFDQF